MKIFFDDSSDFASYLSERTRFSREMSDTEPSALRQRHLLEAADDAEEEDAPMTIDDGARARANKPLGSRSKWSVSSGIEKLLWLLVVPLRALLCISNVTVFFITYFGFMITVLWARKLWPRFYWFYEGKLYM